MLTRLLTLITLIALPAGLMAQGCPNFIEKVDDGESRLEAKFKVTDKPSYIQVRGTNDRKMVNDATGVWRSDLKYTFYEQELILFDAFNNVIGECRYTSHGRLDDGDLNCEGKFDAADVMDLRGDRAVVKWSMDRVDPGVGHYRILRADGDGPYHKVGTVEAHNAQQHYKFVDRNAPQEMSANYQVVATCHSDEENRSETVTYNPKN